MSNLSGFVKRLRDIMRNDAGINGDAHRCLHVCLHQVDAKGVTKLYRNHIAASTRSKFKEMHVVVLVKNYLDVQFAEANIKGADNTLQLVVDVSLLFFVPSMMSWAGPSPAVLTWREENS